MRQDSSGCLGNRHVVPSSLCIIAFSFLFSASLAHAQTQQPYLFATTQVNSNSAVATFTRNDATGALSEVAGSPFVLLTSGCYPATIEPKARYLLGSCGDGISLYQFNATTGVVSEVPNSPFAASTGGAPQAVIAEATGQFAYALRIGPSTFPTQSTAALDSFTIDAANNVLSHPSSQNLTLPGTFIGLIVDPNDHFIEIFLAQPGGVMPMGGSCTIFFDPQSGLPVTSTSGLCQSGVPGGTNPLGISIDARGTFIGTWARGQIFPGFDVFAISPSDGSIQGSGYYLFSQTNETLGNTFFDPTGALIYANTGLSGLRIFALSVAQGTVTISELPSSPLPSNVDPMPLYALADPAADFTFVGGSNVISSYPIDTTTGYPGTPIQSTFNHNPALNFQPIFATMPPAGQAVSAPAVSLSAQSLSFGPINPGQTSGPQTVTVSSTGNEALTISSIAISPSGGPFSEIDSCMTNPVLAPGTSCQIFVTYAPSIERGDPVRVGHFRYRRGESAKRFAHRHSGRSAATCSAGHTHARHVDIPRHHHAGRIERRASHHHHQFRQCDAHVYVCARAQRRQHGGLLHQFEYLRGFAGGKCFVLRGCDFLSARGGRAHHQSGAGG